MALKKMNYYELKQKKKEMGADFRSIASDGLKE